jgi:hypothetical protein
LVAPKAGAVLWICAGKFSGNFHHQSDRTNVRDLLNLLPAARRFDQDVVNHLFQAFHTAAPFFHKKGNFYFKKIN